MSVSSVVDLLGLKKVKERLYYSEPDETCRVERCVTFGVCGRWNFSPAPSQKLKTESQILGAKARRSLSNYCKAARVGKGKGWERFKYSCRTIRERELFISEPFHPSNPSSTIILFPLPQLPEQLPQLPQHFKNGRTCVSFKCQCQRLAPWERSERLHAMSEF